MDEKSNQWIGNIRALLHETQPDAHKIIRAIQQQPNAQAREVAERYALAHFQYIKSQLNIPDDGPIQTERVHYNHTSGTITPLADETNQRTCCALPKRWDDLQPMKHHKMARTCKMCKRIVYKTGGVRVEDAYERIKDKTKTCLHLNLTYNTVEFFTVEHQAPDKKQSGLRKWLQSRLERTPNDNWIVRRTTSTLDVNAAAVMGYRPVIERGDTRSWFEGGQFIQVWQNKRTGEISVQMDTRYALLRPPFVEWQIACVGAYYDRQQRIGAPFIAYLIPANIPTNSKVYIKQEFTAIWNGTSLEQKEYIQFH